MRLFKIDNSSIWPYSPNETRSVHDGIQHKFSFLNGYGASVVRHSGSYGGDIGLWEIAGLKNGELNYETPITNDVLGYVHANSIYKILDRISNL